jgi:RimJ/RimL family protein N-acetyltransferase
MFAEEFESDSLRFAPAHDDLAAMELHAHVSTRSATAAVELEHLPGVPFETPKETADVLASWREQWDSHAVARYAVRPTEGEHAGEFGGICNLEFEWDHRRADLGIWVHRLVQAAFERYDLEVVTVWCLDENDRARQAIEAYVDHIGGGYEGLRRNEHVKDGEPRDAHYYSVTAAEWRERREERRVAAPADD